MGNLNRFVKFLNFKKIILRLKRDIKLIKWNFLNLIIIYGEEINILIIDIINWLIYILT